jgi:hypothetical protein
MITEATLLMTAAPSAQVRTSRAQSLAVRGYLAALLAGTIKGWRRSGQAEQSRRVLQKCCGAT